MAAQRFLKWAVSILCLGVAAFALTACGDDDGNGNDNGGSSSCTRTVENAAKDFPKRLKGEISLTYQGMEIPVPIDVTVERKGKCELEMITRQDVNPLCGSAFKGTLNYIEEDESWEGDLYEYEEVEGEYVEDLPTKLITNYRFRDNDRRVRVWNKMEGPRDILCQDQIIEGTIDPR